MYCPPPFLVSGNGCVYDCSVETGYSTVLGTQSRCVRTADRTRGFDLRPVSRVPLARFGGGFGTPLSLEQLRTASPYYYGLFDAERTRAKGEVAILNEQIGRDTLLADAFRDLQSAENARDRAPDAYQRARIAYYTLLNGDTWLSQERERVARAEVDPIIQKYRNDYVALSSQLNQQTQAYDTMQGIKDKVFRVKDDLSYSADLLMGHVQKIRSQIMLDRRKRESGEGQPDWYGWVDMTLNILLVVALVAAVWFVFKKLRSPKAPGAAPAAPAFTEGTT